MAVRAGVATAIVTGASIAAAQTPEPSSPPPEIRGTWLTTTANDAIASPDNTAETMRRLREIGLNTVYVEVWKNGYTQYPSSVLKRAIGVDRRPNLMPQDPSDTPEKLRAQPRDLLQETLIEAHRNQLIYIAWFEYGFMAAHKSTDSHLRRMKKDWLSLDRSGNEVAPNGFVWMNPLHPEARRFLTDLVLEAVETYDLDGVQLDDRIVWPYVTMGYDPYTVSVYKQEHDGKEPPADHKDPAWMRWRADNVTEFAATFTAEIRARRPGLIISVSPAPYPWVYDNYLCEWPTWATWGDGRSPVGKGWDEFIPQNYRFNFDAFKTTWMDQLTHIGDRRGDLIAGIRVVGDGPNSTWDDLRKSIELVRTEAWRDATAGGAGHVHWFSRGVLDVYPKELTEFYNVAEVGHARHPKFSPAWRPGSIVLNKGNPVGTGDDAANEWKLEGMRIPGDHTLIVKRARPDGSQSAWEPVADKMTSGPVAPGGPALSMRVVLPANVIAVELLIDRRKQLSHDDRGLGDSR